MSAAHPSLSERLAGMKLATSARPSAAVTWGRCEAHPASARMAARMKALRMRRVYWARSLGPLATAPRALLRHARADDLREAGRIPAGKLRIVEGEHEARAARDRFHRQDRKLTRVELTADVVDGHPRIAESARQRADLRGLVAQGPAKLHAGHLALALVAPLADEDPAVAPQVARRDPAPE